ncbi:uncharacterized protein syt18b [Mugil cephalus]|uniref:uncharacterized protein syt18b n=1 Tax=Mugil cephalus TaxID=48193 RepID=UPI001FB7F7D6|nr:uncharacterized protein syt18b [Mugil cephalus]
MPYHDEEYPGQPLWQSVLLFCCKGMIEGIMVILFFWLLVQVLFTKQLEVHLQVLLLVGLITFCLCLFLGCILCWRRNNICPAKDKGPSTSAQGPADPVTYAQSPAPSAATTATSRQQYEEVDSDMLEYPSTFTSPAPSEGEFTSLPFSTQTQTSSEQKESYFSLRRLSTPLLTSPLYKPIDHDQASLPAFSKLGLLSKTCKALQRRCSLAPTGGSASYNEHSRLTGARAASCSTNEGPIPLAPLSYGTSASCMKPLSPKPRLHFTMAFSAEQQTLAVTVLNLTEMPHRLEDVSVMGSLPPLYPCPIQATVQHSCCQEAQSLVLLWKVSSVMELQRCALRIVVYARESESIRGAALGELEIECGGRDWRPENPFHFTKELRLNKWETKKDLIFQDSPASKGLSCPPQIFIMLQYQTLPHRVKATVLRTDNLDNLVPTPGAAEYQVVINLHHGGVLISSRETKGRLCTVWNTSFLFDLPPGDISQLPLMLEFIIMQSPTLSEAKVVGRVLIGEGAADAGRAHWRDMCGLQVEQARWHTIQPEPL